MTHEDETRNFLGEPVREYEFDEGEGAFAGWTDDRLEVPLNYKLKFTPISIGSFGWDGTIIAISLEWNEPHGYRRPYMAVSIGPIHFQSGWLWDTK